MHYGEPRVDDRQDYKLLHGAEKDGHTILKFERKLDTCDDAQDWMITVGVHSLYYTMLMIG